jgi:hypothetical protein
MKTVAEVRAFKNGLDREARRRVSSTLQRIGLTFRDVADMRAGSRQRKSQSSTKKSSYRWTPKD